MELEATFTNSFISFQMRHHVPDIKTQQQQQQSFLASIQQQSSMVKDFQSPVVPATSVIKSEEFGLIEQSMITKSSSINNCIISMNSNGQYQIKPRIIMKDPVKTMSPLIFSTAPVTNAASAGIQIVGVYSQVPMMSDKKIIIKNEPTSTTSVVSFADTTKHLLEPTTGSNLNHPNLL